MRTATSGGEQEAIAQWLLHGPAQVRTGPHAGAVAGTIDRDGRATYAYPEITGYFLQWLAWRASDRGADPELTVRAEAAQQWLARWLGEGEARGATRIALTDGASDWRNQALFCFDLAMVLRGVGTAARVRLIEPDPAVVTGVSRLLERLIASDGQFDACVALAPDVELPQRWSTRRGGFLAKAAAGILSAASSLSGVSANVRAAAALTCTASLRCATEMPHDDVHALMYTFEGIVSLPRAQAQPLLPDIAAQLEALLNEARTLGRVPESRRHGAATDRPERVDVLAQTIRIGHLLGALRPRHPPDQVGLARLRQALAAAVGRDGAVPFAIGAEVPVQNVWAAMFAEQALGFASRAEHPQWAAECCRLVV